MENTESDYYRRHIIMYLLSLILGIGSIFYGYMMKKNDPGCNILFTWIIGSIFILFGIMGLVMLILEKIGKLED